MPPSTTFRGGKHFRTEKLVVEYILLRLGVWVVGGY